MSKQLRFWTTVLTIGVIITFLSWFNTEKNTYTFCSNIHQVTTVYHGFPLNYYGGSNVPCHYTINRAVGLGVQLGTPGNHYTASGSSWDIGSLAVDSSIWSLLAALVLGIYHRFMKTMRSGMLRK